MQRKAEHKQKLREAMQAGQHILIDLDFDGEMTEDQVSPARCQFTTLQGKDGANLRDFPAFPSFWPMSAAEFAQQGLNAA